MKILSLLFFSFLIAPGICFSQVGIGTTSPNPSAILEMASSNKGFLLPRINLTGRSDNTTITNPANGLMVFNIDAAGSGTNAVSANSLYFRQNAVWQKFSTSPEVIALEFKNQYVLKSLANQQFTATQINSINANEANEVPLTWTAGEIFLDSTDDVELQQDNQTIKVITAGSYRVLANFIFNPARSTTGNNDNYSSVIISVMVSKNDGVSWTAVSGAAMPYDIGGSNMSQTLIVPRTILKFEANDLIRIVASKPASAPNFGTNAGVIYKASGDTTKLFRMRRLNVN